MKETGLQPEAVIQILGALKDLPVRTFKYRGLFVELHQEAPKAGDWTSVPDPGVQSPGPATPAASSVSAPPVESAIEQDEDDHLEQIKLEDPEEYEKLLERRELTDADTDDR